MAKATVPTIPNTSTPEEVHAQLKETGCCIIENLVPKSHMERMLEELDPWFEKTPVGTDDFTGFKTQRVSSLVAKSKAYGELVMNPTMVATANLILGERCDTIQLGCSHCVRIAPGETGQLLHRDDTLYSHYPKTYPKNGEELIFNMFWATTEYTATNGATQAVPYSHLWEADREPAEEETAIAVMPQGSVMCFLGSCFHGGGNNTTKDEFRVGSLVEYSLGWLRQEENQYLVVPPEIAKTLPDDLAKMIGYSIQEPYLGWVEMNDPHITLETDDYQALAAQKLFSSTDAAGIR
jgi:hypothetical protein